MAQLELKRERLQGPALSLSDFPDCLLMASDCSLNVADRFARAGCHEAAAAAAANPD
jgi:hypothetical protein